MAKDFSISSKVLDTDKYVYREERDLAKTQVDWGTISKNLTDTINTVRDDRETQKAEIEKANTEAMNRAGEFDQYNSKSLNESVLEGSEWAKNAMSVQMDLVRRGLVTPGENQRYQQRVSDSFTQLKGSLDSFAKHYDEAATRTQEGISVIGEQAINNTTSGLANLGQYELSGNPATGELHYVHTGINPETGEPYDPNNPANQISLSVINSRMNQKMDYVATSDSAQLEVDKLGEVVDAAVLAQQGVKTMEDWRLLDKNGEMMDRMVGVITNTPAQKLSILQEAGYTAEDFTEDPNTQDSKHPDYDPSKILMVPNPDKSGGFVFEFNEEQEAEIEKNARLALEAQISKKAGFTKGFQKEQPTNISVGEEDRSRRASGLYGEVVKFVTGDAAGAESAGTALAAIVNDKLPEGESTIANIERSANGDFFTVTRENGDVFKVSTTATDNVTPLSTTELVKQLFQELNPYDNVDIDLAVSEFTGEVPDAVGEGGAAGNVAIKKIKSVDMNSAISVGGEEQSIQTWLNSQFDGDFTNWFGGANMTAYETRDVFNPVIDQLINRQLRDNIAKENGEIGIIWPQGNRLNQPMIIRVGQTDVKLEEWDDGTGNDILAKIEEAIKIETDRLNEAAGGGMGNF